MIVWRRKQVSVAIAGTGDGAEYKRDGSELKHDVSPRYASECTRPSASSETSGSCGFC